MLHLNLQRGDNNSYLKLTSSFELDGLAHWTYVKMGGVIVMSPVGLRKPVLASSEFPNRFEDWKLHIWMCGRYRRWAMIDV